MRVKALLDEAAAEATAGLRIDLERLQLAQASRATDGSRLKGILAPAIAAAAVILLISRLMPGGLVHAASVVPATSPIGPVGVPKQWFYAPPWTPPVTRHPMFSASMVLADPLEVGGQQNVRSGGPVLVSSDGRQYASLPWTKRDGLVVLSADGQKVAWVTQSATGDEGVGSPIVHRIRLSDGSRSDVALGKSAVVRQLLWNGDSLAVVADGHASVTGTWMLDPGSDVPRRICECSSYPLASDGANLLRPDADSPDALEPVAASSTTIEPLSEKSSAASAAESTKLESPALTVAPSLEAGSTQLRTAAVVRFDASGEPSTTGSSFELQISGGKTTAKRQIRIRSEDGVTDAEILGWAHEGVVVRVHTLDPVSTHRKVTLSVFDPDTGKSKVMSQQGSTRTYPVAVAMALVAGGTGLVADEPQFPITDRSHVRYLVVNHWLGFMSLATLFGIILAIAGLAWRRMRVRR